MTNKLAVNVSYEKWNKGWGVDYNHTYGLVKRGINTKDKAEDIAKSEAQARANGRGKPVDVRIYKKNGELQRTITKKPTR